MENKGKGLALMLTLFAFVISFSMNIKTFKEINNLKKRYSEIVVKNTELSNAIISSKNEVEDINVLKGEISTLINDINSIEEKVAKTVVIAKEKKEDIFTENFELQNNVINNTEKNNDNNEKIETEIIEKKARLVKLNKNIDEMIEKREKEKAEKNKEIADNADALIEILK